MNEESREFSIDEALEAGRQYMQAGNPKSAETMFRGVLVHEPQNFDAIERLGSACFEQGKFYEALYWFWFGLELDRKEPMAQGNYGLTLTMLGHADKGLPYLERACVIAEHGASYPVRALVWNNLGNTLERLGKYKDALSALDKGIAYGPQDPFPRYNRGIVLMRLGRHDEALASFDKCLALEPDNADAHYNRGMARLILGDLKGGFEDYEYRLVTTENKEPNFGFPAEKKWNGETLPDTPLLLIAEQGLGDTIQFLRFIPEVRRRARNLSLAVPSAVAPMVKEQWPDVTLVPAKAVIPHDQIGRWAALMSLPRVLGVQTEGDIPWPWRPLLDDERFVKFGRLLRSGFRVGVCWAGNFHHKNDGNRSVPLDVFARLFEAKNCEFVSLQQLRPGEERQFAALRERYGIAEPELKDLRDTAEIIANCDLVISADTAVAHLAGSVGVRTWVLVPCVNTDWRWQLRRTDSPWYPTARLWRAEPGKGWKPVIEKMMQELPPARKGAA